MTKPIPEQYKKYYTPEQIRRIDELIAFEREFSPENLVNARKGYIRLLSHGLEYRSKEYNSACDELDTIKNAILIEALGTLAAGGLEITLVPDEDGIVSVDQLLPYASRSTQQQYRQTYEKAKASFEKCEILDKAIKEEVQELKKIE